MLPVTIKTAVKHKGIKKVAVLYGNDDVFTKSGYDNFKKALDDAKIPVTTTETFAKGDVDFKAQLTKIKATQSRRHRAVGADRRGRADHGAGAPARPERAGDRRQRHELGQGVRPRQGRVRRPVGRQPVGAGQPDAGEPALRGRLHAKVQGGARPVRRPGLRRDAHRRQGAAEDQAQRQPRRRPQGAARRAAGGAVDRRDRRVQVPPGDNAKAGKPAGYRRRAGGRSSASRRRGNAT